MRHALLRVVWTEMCVGSVCTQPPYNNIILISLNHFPFLISSHSQMPVCVTSHKPKPSHDCWLTLAFYLRPALSKLSSVHHCFDAGADVDWGVLLLDVIMEHSSRHLLLTSEPLKTQWITFVFEGYAPPDLPKCIYVHANHSWSSLTYKWAF